MSGWIKLHRKIGENTLLKNNPAARHVFMDLLWMAAWSDCSQDWKGSAVDLKRGQCLISFRKLADECGMSVQKTRTIVSALMNHQIVKIDTDGTSRPMVITICNYDVYQDHQHRPNTQPNTEPTQTQHTKEEREEIKKKETTVKGRRTPLFEQGELPTDMDPDLERIRQAWNGYAKQADKAQVRKLTKDRRDVMRQIMADNHYTIDDVIEAVDMAGKSEYLAGVGWFNFDWLFKEGRNISKVQEGNYGNGRHAEADALGGMTPKEYQQYVLNGGQ